MVETDEGSNNETKEPETPCPRSVMKLTVQNPVTRTTDVGRYTTYEITLETTHIAFTLSKSCVRRRYSDLVWLRSWLAYNCPDRILPAIPPKKFFSARFGDDVIETRRLGYQRFLQRLLEEGAYLSEGCLHLFLQTPLSVEEIAECMRSHSSAADIIRMVEMFSVTSPSGDSVLYCHDNCSVYGSSKPSELQTPETRVCHLVAGNGGLTNNLSDSTNSQSHGTSTASTSGIPSFDDKSDTSLTSSSSHAGDGLVSPPVVNDELRDKKTIEKVTFLALVEDVSGGGLSDPC